MKNRAEYQREWRKKNPTYYKDWRDEHPEYRSRQHKRNKQILHELKINGCAICGYNECDAALEFHHVNHGDKLFCLSAIGIKRHSNNEIAKEINKCILFCANCHKEKHWCNKEMKEK
jgi:hypothetical protein